MAMLELHGAFQRRTCSALRAGFGPLLSGLRTKGVSFSCKLAHQKVVANIGSAVEETVRFSLLPDTTTADPRFPGNY